MRTIYGMLAASLLLFLGAVTFFVMGWRQVPQPEPGAPAATVQQLMQGVIVPSSKAIYDAVSTVVTQAGTTDTVPRTDHDWQVVGSHALALAEAANLLKTGGRARDNGDWIRLSDGMRKAAMQAARAAEKKSPEGLLSAGEVLNNSCESCHRNYDVDVH